jgi:hypothetical protein
MGQILVFLTVFENKNFFLYEIKIKVPEDGNIIININCCGDFSSLENRDYGRKGPASLTMRHPSIRKSWH